MAEKNEQGTGKHPHKSSEDPRPHHEAAAAKAGHEGGSHSGSESKGGQHASSGSSKAQGQTDSADLKSREYTDAQGNVHHHTKAYEEQHKGGK